MNRLNRTEGKNALDAIEIKACGTCANADCEQAGLAEACERWSDTDDAPGRDDAERAISYRSVIERILLAWVACDATIIIPPSPGTPELFEAIGAAFDVIQFPRKVWWNDPPSEGVSHDGIPWCGKCPDGECTGREKLDVCDIRKQAVSV